VLHRPVEPALALRTSDNSLLDRLIGLYQN
jgi:hypothetical protein